MILPILLTSLSVLSFALLVWQVVVAASFPLHRRRKEMRFAPGITLLKPLKGCDSETLGCLRSWINQDYPGPRQILFGAASVDDPVSALVEQLIEEHPGCDARMIICDERLGPNAKVSQLVQLERLAEHDFLCVSDADVWAPPDFLSNAVAALSDGRVGLVNSFYGFAGASGFGMRWEAFAVNADFWSQVLQARSLKPIDFALGAAMVLPRARLQASGGFEVLLESLADDYQLGKQICRGGVSVELCPVLVECRSAPMNFAEAWEHQLRWARTIRMCQPWPFFFSIVSNASLWPLLCFFASPSWLTLGGAAFCLAARAGAGIYLEHKMTRRWSPASGWLAWLKDILQLGMWVVAFTGRDVIWRGERYRVEAGGKLVRLGRVPSRSMAATGINREKAVQPRMDTDGHG